MQIQSFDQALSITQAQAKEMLMTKWDRETLRNFVLKAQKRKQAVVIIPNGKTSRVVIIYPQDYKPELKQTKILRIGRMSYVPKETLIYCADELLIPKTGVLNEQEGSIIPESNERKRGRPRKKHNL
jgi:hypothetical protein